MLCTACVTEGLPPQCLGQASAQPAGSSGGANRWDTCTTQDDANMHTHGCNMLSIQARKTLHAMALLCHAHLDLDSSVEPAFQEKHCIQGHHQPHMRLGNSNNTSSWLLPQYVDSPRGASCQVASFPWGVASARHNNAEAG